MKAEQAESAVSDSYVLVLGSKQGGKSTLVNAFLNPAKEDTPKPTLGLDYSFARRQGGSSALAGASAGAAVADDREKERAGAASPGIGPSVAMSSSSARDVCHVWELGGNSLAFAELTSIVLTPQRLPTCVVVLVLDLSRPADALASGARWLGALRARMAEVMDRIAKAGARKGPAAAAAAGGGAAGSGGAASAGGGGAVAAGGAGSGAGGMAGLSGDAAVEHLRNMATLRRRVGWAQRSGSALAVSLPAAAAAAGSASGSAAAAAEAQPRTLTDLRSPALTPAAVASLLASVPEHPDARVVASTTLPCQLLVVGARSDGLRDADSVRRKVVFSALRYLAHCHGGALVTTSSRDRASLAGFRGLMASLAFGSDARRGAQTDGASSGRPLYIPAGADVIESIGAPVAVAGGGSAAAAGAAGASRAEIDNGGASFDARFERFLAPARQFSPPSPPGGPGSEWDDADPSTALPAPSSIAPGASITFADEASRHPEPLIDSLRVQRAEEAARYAREAERRLRLEAKASATGAPGIGSSGTS